jgi:predicted esterase
MKKLLWMLLALPSFVLGQQATYTEIQNKSIASGTNGYVEYLPENYSQGQFPVVIFLHGVGERGNGANELFKVSSIGPTSFIKWTSWRPNVIMIAPQWNSPSTWPTPEMVDQVINYVTTNYRVDKNRVYLTGLSMGGGATWDYASSSSARAGKLAAILPVCGYSGGWSTAGTISAANLPVLATHNRWDPTVPYDMSVSWVNNINAGKPTPAALLLSYNNTTHNAWDSTYNPNLFLLGGKMNWLDWMLQYSKGSTPTTTTTTTAPAPAPTTTTTTPTTTTSTGTSIMILPKDEKNITVTKGWPQTTTDIYGTTRTISGTTQQDLYNAERWGVYSYAVPVTSGTYTVKFYFTELFHNSVGKRVFNVDLEGSRVITNFDILASVPKFTALERSFTTTVSDGTLNIGFVPVVDNATMSAIEIIPATSSTSTSTTPTTYTTTIEIRDSATNTLLKTYTDTFTKPVKVTVKNN